MMALFDLSQDRQSDTPLDQDSARTALDELFTLAGKYNSSDAYLELMRFVGRFRFYSPFNAMLIYTQMPGAHFVCTARRWRKDFRREIKISARPIVILQPMRPHKRPTNTWLVMSGDALLRRPSALIGS
jgi:hypothetical protein